VHEGTGDAENDLRAGVLTCVVMYAGALTRFCTSSWWIKEATPYRSLQVSMMSPSVSTASEIASFSARANAKLKPSLLPGPIAGEGGTVCMLDFKEAPRVDDTRVDWMLGIGMLSGAEADVGEFTSSSTWFSMAATRCSKASLGCGRNCGTGACVCKE
jgi:hypothetical protein